MTLMSSTLSSHSARPASQRRQPPETPWQPLLDGLYARRALEAVEAIADRLGALPALDTGPADRVSLADGYAGLAVLFGYLAKARPGRGHEATVLRFLGEAITAASQAPLQASLYAGLAGVGWAAEHLRQQLLQIVAEEINEEVDEGCGSTWIRPGGLATTT
jgi:hypothetical protein